MCTNCWRTAILLISLQSHVQALHSPHRPTRRTTVTKGTKTAEAGSTGFTGIDSLLRTDSLLRSTPLLDDRHLLDSPHRGRYHQQQSFVQREARVHKQENEKRHFVKPFLNWHNSKILGRIAPVVAFMGLWTTAVALIVQAHHGGHSMIFNSKIHGLLSPALSLLLVFRTNAAYNRFWEGRKVWERLANLSRNYVRQTSLYSDHVGGPSSIRQTALHLSALPYALTEHLTLNRHTEKLESYLTPPEMRHVDCSFNRPLGVLQLMTRTVRRIPECVDPPASQQQQRTGPAAIPFSSRDRLSLLKIIEDMTSCVGACERLVGTPVPPSYGRHTARFLGMYCLTLPLAVVGELGFLAVPVVSLLTWGLYGVQEIGLCIEDPFSVSNCALDLEELSDQIAYDALAMAREEAELMGDPAQEQERPLVPCEESW